MAETRSRRGSVHESLTGLAGRAKETRLLALFQKYHAVKSGKLGLIKRLISAMRVEFLAGRTVGDRAAPCATLLVKDDVETVCVQIGIAFRGSSPGTIKPFAASARRIPDTPLSAPRAFIVLLHVARANTSDAKLIAIVRMFHIVDVTNGLGLAHLADGIWWA